MEYTDKLIELFKAHVNPENIDPMTKYLRNQFSHLGIKTPDRKALLKAFIAENGWPELVDLSAIIRELWQQPAREFQYVGIAFSERFKKRLTAEHLPLFEELILTKSWWDTVDGLAVNGVGEIMKRNPDQISAWTEKWMQSDNFWLQRTCLLFQLKYKTNTDVGLMTSFIERLADSNEFFVQKAIGWVLREYSKTNPEFVTDLINVQTLKPLSRREGLKYLNRRM